jgi:5-formyltetrahydrofolate cyclo-ligase
MFYFSFGGEVSTEEMIKAAKKLGKIVVVPVCRNACDRIMNPCLLTSGAKLEKGPYGVREPVEHDPIDIKNLDLVIVPGLAFDKKGNRLGRGKGCYDMFLKRLSSTTSSIGLAYDFQILPSIPTTKADVSVDRVIFA